MGWLDTLFGGGKDIGAAQECARAVLIFFYGWIAVRLVGRRVFGKWAALDIIVSIVIGSNLSRALTGSAPLWGTLAASTALLVLHWCLAQSAARWRPVSRIVEGRPIRLAEQGRPDPAAMRRWSVSGADLEEALRQKALHGIGEAETAMLEPSGSISIIPARRG